VIDGGGPVLTIGADGEANTETISIAGLTVSGGRNNSVPTTSVTLGGGILVYGAPGRPGATVSITDAVVRDNNANPSTYDDCGSPCAFALGGGIFNGGRMTLDNVRILDNVSGPSVSRAWAGGIWNDGDATLTVKRSTVDDNKVLATGPYGEVSESGGIHNLGVLVVQSSEIAENLSMQSSGLTIDQDHVPNAGGITDHNQATIRDSVIRDNRVVGINTNAAGFTNAFGGGIVAKGDLTLVGSRVTGNSVTVVSAGIAVAEAGGIEVDPDATGATIRDSVVEGNAVQSLGKAGNLADGGGLSTQGGTTRLERTRVRSNSVRAYGGHAPMPWGDPSAAEGGGIAHLAGDPAPSLALVDSAVIGNSIAASRGITVAGGGVYTAADYTATRTVVSGNRPDQCAGPTC